MTPLDLAWRELAEAEVEHDVEHARRALDMIRRLEQRRGDDVFRDEEAEG